MRRFGADIVGGILVTGGFGMLVGCTTGPPPVASEVRSSHGEAVAVDLPTRPHTPNLGELSVSPTLALPGVPSALVPADLDEDGVDEILVRAGGAWWVASDLGPDVLPALAPVLGALDDTLAAAGAGRVIGLGATPSVATLSRRSEGWVVQAEPVAHAVSWAMVLPDWTGDAVEDVALVVDGALQLRAGPLDPTLDDGSLELEITDWPGDDVPAQGCRVLEVEASDRPPGDVYLRTTTAEGGTELLRLEDPRNLDLRVPLAEATEWTSTVPVATGCDFDAQGNAITTDEGVWRWEDGSTSGDDSTLELVWASPGAIEVEVDDDETVLAFRGDAAA